MGAPFGNKYAIGNNGGRPPHYSTPDELIRECNAYFDYILGEEDTSTVNAEGEIEQPEKKWIRKPEPPTVTGLSLYLGFESRQSLFDYGKRDEFSYIIKRAIQRVEYGYELNLHGERVTGSIFALKNMGWKDKTEQDVNMNVAPIIIDWNDNDTSADKV